MDLRYWIGLDKDAVMILGLAALGVIVMWLVELLIVAPRRERADSLKKHGTGNQGTGN